MLCKGIYGKRLAYSLASLGLKLAYLCSCTSGYYKNVGRTQTT